MTTNRSAKKPAPRKVRARRAAPRGADVLWQVIARVRKKSKGDLDDAIEGFEKELAALDDAALVAVEAAFQEAMDRANHWDLWGAAYLIHGVISDDMFWDVRSGVVALGREVFEAAIADADSLASVKDVVEATLFEGFQYVPDSVVEERGLQRKVKSGRSKMSGKRWNVVALEKGDNSALTKRFPRLAKRFAD